MRAAAILIVSALAIAACSRNADARENEGAGPSGVSGSRDFQVGAFDKVAVRGPHHVTVSVGPAISVRAEGDSALLDRLEIVVKDGELRIGTRKEGGGWFGHSDGRLKAQVHITVPALAAAAIAGSGDLRVDKVRGDRFDASIAGSGDIEVSDLRVRHAAFEIAGSGGMRAKGAAESSDVSIAGSGDVDISGLESRNAKISVAGSGDVRAHASETANVSVMGSGDVTMSGPGKCSVKTMGSGTVHCDS
jgi:hypothetical protein